MKRMVKRGTHYEKLQIKNGEHFPETFDEVWRSERKHGVLRARWVKSEARTQDIVNNEVVQSENQRMFERLTKKLTKQFEKGIMQSSSGGVAMAAGRPTLGDSQMTLAAVVVSATTQSTTSSRIRVVETEDQFNTECQKVLAGVFDRHESIVYMDTCRAIDRITNPNNCDG